MDDISNLVVSNPELNFSYEKKEEKPESYKVKYGVEIPEKIKKKDKIAHLIDKLDLNEIRPIKK